MSCAGVPATGEAPAGVACAHRAWLGESGVQACGCTGTPTGYGAWQVATAPGGEDLVRAVVADLDRGISPAGALLRAADAFGEDQAPLTVVAAGPGQLAALGWRTTLRYAATGAGNYVLDAAAHPVSHPAPNVWLEAPPGSVLLLDPCGPTVTLVQEPELR